MNTVMLWPDFEDLGGIEGNVSCTIIVKYSGNEKFKLVDNIIQKPVIVNVKKLSDCYCGEEIIQIEIKHCRKFEKPLFSEPDYFEFVLNDEDYDDSNSHALVNFLTFTEKGRNTQTNRPNKPIQAQFHLSSRKLALPALRSVDPGGVIAKAKFIFTRARTFGSMKRDTFVFRNWIAVILVFLCVVNMKRIWFVISRVAGLVAHCLLMTWALTTSAFADY